MFIFEGFSIFKIFLIWTSKKWELHLLRIGLIVFTQEDVSSSEMFQIRTIIGCANYLYIQWGVHINRFQCSSKIVYVRALTLIK